MVPFPCLHQDCLCTFSSINALKVHLSKIHTQAQEPQLCEVTELSCQLCDFSALSSEAEFLTHLRRTHLKVNHRVQCPYHDCDFNTNVYSTFNAHVCKQHKTENWRNFKPDIIASVASSNHDMLHEEPVPLDDTLDIENDDMSSDEEEVNDLGNQLEHNLANLFLKMQTILHIPEKNVQEAIEGLLQIYEMSQPLLHNSVKDVLKRHTDVNDEVVKEVVEAARESNVLVKFCSNGRSLATSKRRTTYVNKNFDVVRPVEYTIDREKKASVVYVPLIAMLQKMLSRTDILEKARPVQQSASCEYSTYRDGSYCKENDLLGGEGLKIAIGLYTDDFEVGNPLGTSKKAYKMTAVYWVLANMPSKYRSTLHSIQLALLCKVSHVRQYGFAKILHPLIHDLVYLETHGVYVDRLGESVRGTLSYVAADNLAAHSLAGFYECFSVDLFCRFCMVTRSQMQEYEVCSGTFEPRTKHTHNQQVEEVRQDTTLSRQYGVKRGCVFSEKLEYFHVVQGYPPDILHDLLEGVVPVELSLCIADLISKRYFKLEDLNNAIRTFPYDLSDKTNQPKPIAQDFAAKGTVSGNGHENWALIRLFPLLIGHKVPEGDSTWHIVMLLKDIVELAVATKHTDETIHFLQCVVSEHREVLTATFPNYRLRPKHHYIEHYAEMIKRFGPLVHVWTMRFEGKHTFFKETIKNARNFRNVALTMAEKHQKMIAFHLGVNSFFRPSVELDKVTTQPITSYPKNVQQIFSQKIPGLAKVLDVSSVSVDGITYSPDMIISVGSCSGVPEFKQIKQIVTINTEILFVCQKKTAWYHEHYRSFELCDIPDSSQCVVQLHELNDVFPLPGYRFGGNLIVTLKRFILC